MCQEGKAQKTQKNDGHSWISTKRCKKRLNEKKMTFKELAMEINTSQSYLSLILHGQRKGKAAKKVLEKVSDLLEVSIL